MFCWKTFGSGIHVHVTLAHITYIVAGQVHPFIVTVIPNGSGLNQGHPATLQNCSEMVWETWQKVQVLTWPLNPPDLNPIEHLWEVLDKQVQPILQDLLQTFWCQIPQHILRGLVESMPPMVRAILVTIHTITHMVLLLWLIGEYLTLQSKCFCSVSV